MELSISCQNKFFPTLKHTLLLTEFQRDSSPGRAMTQNIIQRIFLCAEQNYEAFIHPEDTQKMLKQPLQIITPVTCSVLLNYCLFFLNPLLGFQKMP